MRNLIRVHCKRFFFRWETYAITFWNLFLGMAGYYLASVLFWDLDTNSRYGFIWFFLLFYVLALGGTVAAVTSMETNNLSSGGLRNLILGGYNKAQIFVSKYLVMTLFGMVQGALFIAPVTFLRVAGDYAVGLLISSVLVFAAVACAIMTCCLMTDRQTTAVLCCFFGAALLAAGAVYGASALDQPEYTYTRVFNSLEKYETAPNNFYVSEPKRTLLEHTLRLNPVQPVYEYCGWYFVDDGAGKARLQAIAEYDALAALEVQQGAAEAERHLARIKVLPIYQVIFLLLAGCAGTLLFRKRNLK